ncbi:MULTISPECIES: hypothetical protein [Nocardioides]|uniref:hypothetical protein n=1 Tax=Nocardioides TaxID=1839 RepID=UPI00032F72B9|nr:MULTISPECIES: hypothetical protein [Nocardioides]EON24100.1 hypoteical [Nocardioides sp. CF8]
MTMTTRLAALIAPSGLLVYSVLRWLDGRDGHHGPGLAWDLGHSAFLIAFIAFATLTVAIGRTVATRIALMTTATTVLGAALFVWVIVGDLSPDFKDWASMPDVLKLIGPPAFVLGFVATLHLAGRSGVAPRSSAWLALVGFVLIIVELDLLPLAASCSWSRSVRS